MTTAVPLVWEPGDVTALSLNVALAVAASVASGYWAHRLPVARLQRDGPILRLRSFEAAGRFYERRLGIRRWKDRLPEAGAFFPGGQSKARLPGTDVPSLDRFAVETRRAERAHWVALAVVVVVPALWNRWPGLVVMIAYAIVANLPCIMVQRYNRARLAALARRSGRVPGRLSAEAPSRSNGSSPEAG